MNMTEFMDAIMSVGADPSTDDAIDAIEKLTSFYERSSSKFDELNELYEKEKEGRKKALLRYATEMTREEILSPEEVEEKEVEERNKLFEERFEM